METPTKLSFSPSNILARLEELKRWQTEQEERLKKRQAQQREVLSTEQRRMCEAFELTNNSSFTSSVSDSSCHYDNKTAETDQSSHIPQSSTDEIRADSKNDLSTFQECTNLTEQNQANVSVSQLNFDEIPINSIKQTIPVEKSVMSAPVEISDRPKFQYLKRGAGLSRFRMSKDDILKNRTKFQRKPTPKSTEPKQIYKKPDVKRKIEPVWKSVSCSVKSPTSNFKSPDKLERPNPQPYPVITKDSYEKLLEELKIKRDREELKIFELLEEKALNGSFCSTSSALKNLPDNSTPKLERLLKSQLGIAEQNEQTPPISPVKSQRKLYDENEEDKSLHVRFEDGIDDTRNSEESSRSNSPENYQDQIEWSDTSEEHDDDKSEPNFENNLVNTETANNQVAIDEAIEQMRSANETSDSAVDDVEFKSDLLKKRLLELESEIQTFRKENSNLIKRRQEYDHLKRVLLKEKTEKEKLLADEKIRIDKYLEDEKRKIAREKMVFEKYVKDTKNQPNRKEREEIVALKDEIRTLKEELKVKESKNGATQARLRTQIRTLEKELNNAKKEIEKLQKENRRLSNIQKRQAGISNTKVLHEINKNISKILPKALAQTQLKNLEKLDKQTSQNIHKKTEKQLSSSSESEDESSSEEYTQANQSSGDESEGEEPKRSEIHKTLFKTMYPNSKHSYFPEKAKENENVRYEDNDYKENDFNYGNMSSKRLSNKADETKQKEVSPRFESYARAYKESDYCVTSNKHSADNRDTGFESYRSSMNPTFRDVSSKPETRDTGFETFRSSVNPSTYREKLHEGGLPSSSRSQFDSARGSNLNDIEDVYEKTFGKFKSMNINSYPTNKPYTAELPTVKKDETILADGFKEVRYANGNVKRVSPDGSIIKLTYYNGDLKETNLNTGIIKYYYAKTKTSHTTFPDGFEQLEFSNGQTEKRFKNGRIEVNFPNGYKKVVDAQGNETWYYSDGTVVVTKVNGEKIIELPNGQKEIHNQDHKRREYPDGTVKVLYPDGSTETRYSSGRVRIKDKTGQLIMDTQK
ncbi:centromere protein J [Chrysoperla carnea]|uniref:centromere protein J n=1 Tax=Chrysoperla carnea TaxID=189513 RepID=UPI001D064130|nr:centromere protein J [Chrysoperla carnea]